MSTYAPVFLSMLLIALPMGCGVDTDGLIAQSRG
jgi:hypothetical protein